MTPEERSQWEKYRAKKVYKNGRIQLWASLRNAFPWTTTVAILLPVFALLVWLFFIL